MPIGPRSNDEFATTSGTPSPDQLAVELSSSSIPQLRRQMSGQEEPPPSKKKQLLLDTFMNRPATAKSIPPGASPLSPYACGTCKNWGNRCGKELPDCGACTERGRECVYRVDPGPKCNTCQEKGYDCDKGFPCNNCGGKKGPHGCRYTHRPFQSRPRKKQEEASKGSGVGASG